MKQFPTLRDSRQSVHALIASDSSLISDIDIPTFSLVILAWLDGPDSLIMSELFKDIPEFVEVS